MRIPKSYILIAVLIPLCVVAWIPLLQQISPGHKDAESKAFVAQFLFDKLPTPITQNEVFLDLPGGRKKVLFPPLVGRNVGTPESRQIEIQVQFMSTMAMACQTSSIGGWQKIGEASVSGSNGSPVRISIYRMPERKLGFSRGGIYYASAGPGDDALLDYVDASQQQPE